MLHCSWWALLLGSIVVLCFGTACSKRGSAPATPPEQIVPAIDAKYEGSWPLIEVPAEGFALALPIRIKLSRSPIAHCR